MSGNNFNITTNKALSESMIDQPNGVAGLDGDGKLGAIDGSQLTNLPSSGGDVFGPASSTQYAFAQYADATGKLLQNSLLAESSDTYTDAITFDGSAIAKGIQFVVKSANNQLGAVYFTDVAGHAVGLGTAPAGSFWKGKDILTVSSGPGFAIGLNGTYSWMFDTNGINFVDTTNQQKILFNPASSVSAYIQAIDAGDIVLSPHTNRSVLVDKNLKIGNTTGITGSIYMGEKGSTIVSDAYGGIVLTANGTGASNKAGEIWLYADSQVVVNNKSGYGTLGFGEGSKGVWVEASGDPGVLQFRSSSKNFRFVGNHNLSIQNNNDNLHIFASASSTPTFWFQGSSITTNTMRIHNSNGDSSWFQWGYMDSGSKLVTFKSTHAGSAGILFKDGANSSEVSVLTLKSTEVTPHVAFFPAGNGTLDCGKSDQQWKDLYLSGVLKIDGVQVVKEQQAAVADAALVTVETAGGSYTSTEQDMINHLKTDVTTLKDQLNAALAALRAHGLITT